MSQIVTRAAVGTVRPGMSVSLATAAHDDASLSGHRLPWWLPLAGPVAGAALGAVARSWMRLITDDPEFSWSGTLAIVIAFTLAGFGHSIAWTVRSTGWRRRGTMARIAGAVLTMPLFVGAGALMLPTVAAGSFAAWRIDWPRWVRWLLAAVAAAPPVLVVTEIEHRTIRTTAGVVLLLATYAVIVASIRPVIAPVTGAKRMRRATRILAVTGAVLLLLAAASLTVGVATAGL